MVFEVTEGQHQGRRVSRTWTFTDKAIGYSKRDLAAFGLATKAQILDVFPPLGQEVYCRLFVALQRSPDGDSAFNDIKKISDIQTQGAPGQDFLIDPAAGTAPAGGTP